MDYRSIFLEPGKRPPDSVADTIMSSFAVDPPAPGGTRWRAHAAYMDHRGIPIPLEAYGPDEDSARAHLALRLAEVIKEGHPS